MNFQFFITRLRHRAYFLPVLAGTLIAIISYLQTVNTPFISDDVAQVEGNSKLANLPPGQLWRLLTEPYNMVSEFLPLRDFSFWLDLKLFGLNTTAFHLHNILLFALSLPLVFAVTAGIWRYFRPQDAASASWVAASVTALFALHPALVEPVVWITGRKYVLPNFFSLLALWLALQIRGNNSFSSSYAAATLLAFVAVMLSKTSYVGLAPVIAILWIFFWLDIPRQDRNRSLLLWPAALMFLGGLLLLAFISSSFVSEPAHFGMETVPRTLAVLGWLVRLSISPENRHFFYPVADPLLPGMLALGAAALLLSAAAAISMLHKPSLEAFLLLTFLLLSLPNLQIIPYGAPSLVQDRFLALAIWPVILLIASLAWRLPSAPRAALLFVIAVAWGWQTIERPRDWRSYEALIDADISADPGYYMPVAYKIIGFQLPQGLYREAHETADRISITEYRDVMLKLVEASRAVSTGTVAAAHDHHEVMTLLQNLGPILNKLPAEARWNSPVQVLWDQSQGKLLRLWSSLASQFPDDVQIHYNAGLWMTDAGYYSNATVHFRAALTSGNLPLALHNEAYKNLGLALLGSGHAVEAEMPLRAALGPPHPDMQAACLLAAVYKLTNRPTEAARASVSCPEHTSAGK